jgi:hypothetical protein
MTDSALPLDTREAEMLQRALIDYRKLLTLSKYAEIDPSIIASELVRVDAVTERLSLAVFYPKTHYPQVGDFGDINDRA